MRKHLAITASSLVLAFAMTDNAAAQSWNCRSQKNCTEQVICATPQLGRLDERMASLYFQLRGQSNRSGARQLLDSQRSWLASRNSCNCDANCLVGHYTSRIQLFNQLLD